jgi:excisionase family DNA binding protein
VPGFGLTEVGRRVERFGGASAEVVVRGRAVDLTWRTEAGKVVKSAPARVRLVGPDGQGVELPESMFEVLLQVAAAMKAGLAVTVAPHHRTLSTQEAAHLLRISRTTLVRLLETGVIPFDKPSRHRKVRLDDLVEYRRRHRSRAELALADMVADTERLGLYDTDPAEVAAALKAARRAPKG